MFKGISAYLRKLEFRFIVWAFTPTSEERTEVNILRKWGRQHKHPPVIDRVGTSAAKESSGGIGKTMKFDTLAKN